MTSFSTFQQLVSHIPVDDVHPSRFTRGSRWRFKLPREIWGTGQRFSIGDEFVVASSFPNINGGIPIHSDSIHFRSSAHQRKYAKSKNVNGTLLHNEIFRFVEPVSPGLEEIYYIRENDRHHSQPMFYTGKETERTSRHFSEAQYWENPLLAHKKALKLNVQLRLTYSQRYSVYRYNNRTDEHTDVSPSQHDIEIINWLYQNLRIAKLSAVDGAAGSAVEAISDLVLRRIGSVDRLYVVKFPNGHAADSAVYYCGGARIKKPYRAGPFLFLNSLDDAIQVKMATKDAQVLEIPEVTSLR